ncbi:MAG: DUF2860 domain-containing protein [Desulfobacteraceae bacterium]|nr:DUF2860 domain-containing protein [Desulfobacteraceae bacterium]
MTKKTKFLSLPFCLALILLLTPLSALALNPIPKDSGFSGFVKLGGGVLHYKGNMVAGNDFVDVSNDTIASVTASPDDETKGSPFFDGEIGYTFASTRTQIILGSHLDDIARLENAQQLAVKQELPDKSLISLGVLFTGVPTEVWKDPYLTNTPRQSTDRDSAGLKFAFDDILGTNFEFIYSYRHIEIDDEQSGNSLALSSAQKDLLKRDGDNNKISLLYRFNIDKRHILEPGVSYLDQDRDGDAMSNDGYEFQLTYLYFGNPISFVATGMVGQADYDKENPIYGQTMDVDSYLLGFQVFYKEPFGWKPFDKAKFSVYCGLAYYNEDANINFYDTRVIKADLGVFFKF